MNKRHRECAKKEREGERRRKQRGERETSTENQTLSHILFFFLPGKSLTRLDLVASLLTPEVAVAMGRVLSNNPPLKSLSLSHNPIGDTGTRSFCCLLFGLFLKCLLIQALKPLRLVWRRTKTFSLSISPMSLPRRRAGHIS